ncbi:MAG TPA: tetratricopeptide repeat protein [Gemmatimonadales bacterium]|nr:tetratricopeptide repeat protein [Gemmatimonadales bacterium]
MTDDRRSLSDDIRGMTAQLAEDPSSLVFLRLGEALRRRRQLDAALKVAGQGLARYPELADAHDLQARILADLGDHARAFDVWIRALEIDPEHPGANKGIGFLYFKAGEFAEALHHLEAAARYLVGDDGLDSAITRVRERLAAAAAPVVQAAPEPAPAPASAPEAGPAVAVGVEEPSDAPTDAPSDAQVFAGLEGTENGLLLLDAHGLRLGGGVRSPAGEDVSDAVAAQLAGVSREASRAARILGLGDWVSVSAESADGSLHLSAPTAESVLLLLRGPGVPAGRLAVLAERAGAAARRWLEQLG